MIITEFFDFDFSYLTASKALGPLIRKDVLSVKEYEKKMAYLNKKTGIKETKNNDCHYI